MTTDWQNRGGTPQTFAKLPPMDLNLEHEFELTEVQAKDNVPDTYNPGKTVNKIITVWKEVNKPINEAHKIYAEFNEYYSEKASLMKFLCRVTGKPFVPGVHVKLGEYLTIGMRIKARVIAKYNKETGEPTGNYKFAEGIKPALPQPVGITYGVDLQNALLIARGAQNATDAAYKLAEARAPKELTDAFQRAVQQGSVTFPIH